MYGMAKLGWHGSRKRSGGRYQARWCDSEGLQSEGGFISKAQADTYALKMANEALNVKVGLSITRKPIEDARREFLERRTKANTRALNERRIDAFLTAMSEIKDTSHLTRNLIDRFTLFLEQTGHNLGGQEHHLRIVRAFCKFCLDNKWVTEHPFKGFIMPKSDFDGRALTEDEWARMVEPVKRIVVYSEFDKRRGTSRIRYMGSNGAVISVASGIPPADVQRLLLSTQEELDRAGASRPVQAKEVDWWLNRAFRFGHSTMLRISQVWKLTPEDFKAPDQVRVEGIKAQDTVWITLQDEAAAILTELLAGARERGRFFHYWQSVESMRNSVEDKARRVGLPGVRFHDVCKVTRITQLDREGWGLGDLSNVSNTSKKTLAAHYIKADRRRSFEKYKAHASPAQNTTFDLPLSPRGHTRATPGPLNGGFMEPKGVQHGLDGSKEKIENASNSPQILAA